MSSLQLDGNKLIHHLDRVNGWSRGEEISPLYVAFSPTSYCNHHCIFCVYHYKEFKPIFFPLERYKSLALEWASAGVRSVFFAGDGDPLLNKQCDEMVKATKLAGIDIALNTNGRLLNKKSIEVFVENLSFIRISVNAGTPQSYAKIHGTNESDFEIVMKNIESLVQMKRDKKSNITIGVQLVLLSQNITDVKILAEKMKEIGVDYFSIKPFLKHPDVEFNDEIENLDAVLDDFLVFQKEITTNSFSFNLRKNLFVDKFVRHYKKCQSTSFMIEIDALGDIYSCGPYIGNTEHKLGNVMKNSFHETWSSEAAAKVRNHISCNVDVSKCMPFCRPDSVNEFLWKLSNPPQHINYI